MVHWATAKKMENIARRERIVDEIDSFMRDGVMKSFAKELEDRLQKNVKRILRNFNRIYMSFLTNRNKSRQYGITDIDSITQFIYEFTRPGYKRGAITTQAKARDYVNKYVVVRVTTDFYKINEGIITVDVEFILTYGVLLQLEHGNVSWNRVQNNRKLINYLQRKIATPALKSRDMETWFKIKGIIQQMYSGKLFDTTPRPYFGVSFDKYLSETLISDLLHN